MKEIISAVKEQLAYIVTGILREIMVVFLFFAGLALIAVGLWHIYPPVALIFDGAVCVYLGWCVHMTAKSPERTDKK